MGSDLPVKPLTAIVALDRNGAIGCQNRLPWAIKSDMAFFRRTTMGHIVVMGRKTHASIGGCLKGRQNIILSHSAELFPTTENCNFVSAVSEALALVQSSAATEAFVVGGANTYEQFAEFVDRYLVTFVDHEAEDADAFLSSNVREAFSSWKTEELGCFPAVEGQDQFAFKIFSFTAPDIAYRQADRLSLAETGERRFSQQRLATERRCKVPNTFGHYPLPG